MKRHLFTVSMLALGLGVLAISAAAQITIPLQKTATTVESQDFFKINYFSNNGVAGAPDATVRIDNPGTDETANLCAMIYVFDNDQQLSECCGCLVTANGLRTLSVRKDLTGNPLTGAVSNNGVIKIVSGNVNNSPCNPAAPFEAIPTIRAWASHVQNKVGTAYPITETEFTNATLSEAEAEFNLFEQCVFVQRLGSGHGICSCGTGD
jgi:hypothetical protein